MNQLIGHSGNGLRHPDLGPVDIPSMQANRPVKTFDSGATRSTDAENVRYDLVSPIGLRRLAETYAEGAKKYSPNQWLKGIPASDLLNHAIRHIELWRSGERSEDHMAHAAWGLFAVMHFEEMKPEMLDVQVMKSP